MLGNFVMARMFLPALRNGAFWDFLLSVAPRDCAQNGQKPGETGQQKSSPPDGNQGCDRHVTREKYPLLPQNKIPTRLTVRVLAHGSPIRNMAEAYLPTELHSRIPCTPSMHCMPRFSIEYVESIAARPDFLRDAGIMTLALSMSDDPLALLGQWARAVRVLYIADWAMPERNLDYPAHVGVRLSMLFRGLEPYQRFGTFMKYGVEGVVEQFNNRQSASGQDCIFLRRQGHTKFRCGSLIGVWYTVERATTV